MTYFPDYESAWKELCRRRNDGRFEIRQIQPGNEHAGEYRLVAVQAPDTKQGSKFGFQ